MRAVLLALLVLAACSKSEAPPSEGQNPNPNPGAANSGSGTPPGPAPTGNKAAFEARRVFGSICATCHGPGGKGDGMAAQNLNPKPRNYTDKAWQASVTDDEIKKIILLGGQAVGKSATMPAQPQLQAQPEVVDELVKIIRGFAQ